MAEQKKNMNIELGIAALNLTGLGLGYLALRNWRRWAVHFVGLWILIYAGSYAHASIQPMVWIVLFLLYFLWMAYDGWMQARKSLERIPNQLITNPWVLPVLVLTVFIAEIIGFSIYRSSAENVYYMGMAKYDLSNYPSAYSLFRSLTTTYELSLNPLVVVGNDKLVEINLLLTAENQRNSQEYETSINSYNYYIKSFPNSSKINEVNNNIAAIYREWGIALQGQTKYEEALQKYSIALERYPDVAVVRQFYEEMANLNLQLARQQVEDEDYSAAIDTYKIILTKYSNSIVRVHVPDEIADAYVKLAQQYQSKGDFQNSAFNLQVVLNGYQTSAAFKQAQALLPEVLLDQGKMLRDQNHYLDALVNFDQIRKMTTDQALIDSIRMETDATIQLLARDSGADGSDIIVLATNIACGLTQPTDPTVASTLSVVVGILKDEPSTVGLCDSYVPIPPEMITTFPGTLRYVVKREDGQNRVQSCQYEKGHTLERIQYTTTLTLIDVSTGKTILKNKFVGSSPPACPDRRAFSQLTDQVFGGDVPDEKMTEWLNKVIK